jgi:hypothetical protein
MPSVTPDEQDPALQGCEIHMSSLDGTQLQSGEVYSFTISPPLVPSSDQIFARIALTRMECYNAAYNVPSLLSFQYTIQTLSTSAHQTYTINLSPGQYGTSDLQTALSSFLDSRLTFTYDSKAYTFTLASTNDTLYSFSLGTDAALWTNLYLKFPITTEGEFVSSYTSSSVASLVPTENIYVTVDAFQCSSAIRIAKKSYPNIIAPYPYDCFARGQKHIYALGCILCGCTMIASPGDKNIYTPWDAFFVDVRSPSLTQLTICLLDDGLYDGSRLTPDPSPFTWYPDTGGYKAASHVHPCD